MFKMIFVCTGNRCRSPTAEAVMRHLTASVPIRISSVGLIEATGIEAPQEAVRAARALGADLSSHRSRSLERAELHEADLVIGFERRHLAAAVVEGGADPNVVFTLPELVRLLQDLQIPAAIDPIERARAAVSGANAARGRARRFIPGEEIEDPIGCAASEYRRAAREIKRLCEQLATLLFAPSVSS